MPYVFVEFTDESIFCHEMRSLLYIYILSGLLSREAIRLRFDSKYVYAKKSAPKEREFLCGRLNGKPIGPLFKGSGMNP